MNRYRLHEPKEPKVWPKYYPGLRLKHKEKKDLDLTLEYDLIGPFDKKLYWSCKPHWRSTSPVIYTEETLDNLYEPI